MTINPPNLGYTICRESQFDTGCIYQTRVNRVNMGLPRLLRYLDFPWLTQLQQHIIILRNWVRIYFILFWCHRKQSRLGFTASGKFAELELLLGACHFDLYPHLSDRNRWDEGPRHIIHFLQGYVHDILIQKWTIESNPTGMGFPTTRVRRDNQPEIPTLSPQNGRFYARMMTTPFKAISKRDFLEKIAIDCSQTTFCWSNSNCSVISDCADQISISPFFQIASSLLTSLKSPLSSPVFIVKSTFKNQASAVQLDM